MTRINRKSWHTERSKALRQAEQQEAADAKQRASDFRQLFNGYGHLITVNLDSFRIEAVKAKPTPQEPVKHSPVLVARESRRRFNTIERKTGDMSLYYGVKAKSTPPPLLRRKRKLDLRKIYEFIKSFVSVLVKRPDQEAEKPDIHTTQKPTMPMADDPLDEVMVDPVTKLKITRRQWEALGQARKPAEIPVPTEANYSFDKSSAPKQKTDECVNFPPLPKEKKSSLRPVHWKLPKLGKNHKNHRDE